MFQTVTALDIVPRDLTSHVYSAFAQDEFALVEQKLWLTLGSKLDHSNYVGLDAQPNLRLLWMPTAAQKRVDGGRPCGPHPVAS